MQILTNNIIYMRTNLYRVAIDEKVENLEIVSLRDETWKKVMELLSEKNSSQHALVYNISVGTSIIDGSEGVYDIEAFGTILQKYIEHLQTEKPDTPFRLVIEKKNNVDDSFYVAVWNLLKSHADKIITKSNNMILTCE